MEYNSGNYDKYKTRNPLKRHMVSRLNHNILRFVRDAVERQRDHDSLVTILDAGCGEGFITSILFSNIKNVEITGLEYTNEALQIARSMIPEVSFLQGNIMDLPFDDHSFNVVLCTEVLEHLENPDKALSELLRVAENTVIITVPHEPWFRIGNMLALKHLTRLGNPIDHINHWTFGGFSNFLQNNSDVLWTMDKSFPWTIAQSDLTYEGVHS